MHKKIFSTRHIFGFYILMKLLLTHTPSFAVFDFPLEYKLSLTDSYEHYCKSVTPEAFEKWKKKMETSYGDTTKEQQAASRKTEEYKMINDYIMNEIKESFPESNSEKKKECLDMLN
ncbi:MULTISPECIES: hypothetical protein [unclassified Delftia]|uniref:hypothetical protein n=1 Tax=unclassified Delftia TaxID=2613839 RepID=UPI0011510891|nr:MULTISPECIES: hypothetical protein [unclassified Delftia]MCB4785377.1 hypothetical protein [Delftia sp. Lp-1]TQL70845.1 hypothetical protein FB549_4877 [Delftia sp. HK171]